MSDVGWSDDMMETSGRSSWEDKEELLDLLRTMPDVHWHRAVVDSENGLMLQGTNRQTRKSVSVHARSLLGGFNGGGPRDTLAVLVAYGFNEEYARAVLDPSRPHCMFTR